MHVWIVERLVDGFVLDGHGKFVDGEGAARFKAYKTHANGAIALTMYISNRHDTELDKTLVSVFGHLYWQNPMYDREKYPRWYQLSAETQAEFRESYAVTKYDLVKADSCTSV